MAKKDSNDENESRPSNNNSTANNLGKDYAQRITQLEQVVARQEVLIQKLRKECSDLSEAAVAFARVIELLRQAGLDTPETQTKGLSLKKLKKDSDTNEDETDEEEDEPLIYETYDDTEIFGRAPSSIIDAADAAGASILAGMLGGKQRMLVDVRDAELSRDPDTLVQFVELAILPVAAGLEGLRSTRNRVKIVFATVSQLLQYRRTMALAAPEVVALSTLGFDPVEKHDQLVVLIAPSPDDEEGLMAMNELLSPTDPAAEQITQPLVVVNHHMVPVSGPAKDFEVAYHLRLLSVQYMSGSQELNLEAYEEEKLMLKEELEADESADDEEPAEPAEEDEALEAAMKHAHEIGMHQGVTRAMVIRAYPKPWHVFVDTSPDTDADFEVAATFDEEPTQDDVNFAIVECLEGSEREDELVAQQMQQALEAGQLDRVTDMLGIPPVEVDEKDKDSLSKDDDEEDKSDDDDDNFYNDFDNMFEEDSC